jgi:RNA-directed DNA polymerase
MADETSTAPVTEPAQENWREKIKQLGKSAFEMLEMERLGFWPPNEEVRARTAKIRAELESLRGELVPLRSRERELEKLIAQTSDIQSLLAEARTLRIERVKRERAEKKERRAREAQEKSEADAKWRAEALPHLGSKVSRGLKYEGGDPARLGESGLPILKSAQDVAQVLEVSTARLAWLCYDRDALSSPKPQLRAAQDWVLQNILSKVPVDEAAAAFLAGTHIGHNAARHAHAPRGPEVVIRIDLKDFFPSVTFGRVKRGFESLGYNEGVASILSLLCTESPRVLLELDGQKHHVALAPRAVPQGAPTSPALTNILCRRLDARLRGMARHFGFTYSRYADDLVFSSSDENANAPAMIEGAQKVVEDSGFVVNEKKTAVMRRHRRQSVMGLVVNAPMGASTCTDASERLSRRDMRNFRALLHSIETRGHEAVSQKMGQDALAYARGYLSFIHMVSPEQEAKLLAKYAWLQRRGEA